MSRQSEDDQKDELMVDYWDYRENESDLLEIDSYVNPQGLVIIHIGDRSYVRLSPQVAKLFLPRIYQATLDSVGVFFEAPWDGKVGGGGRAEIGHAKINSREKNTLLAVIGGLCEIADFDINKRGIAASLEAALLEQGVKVSEDTIRNIFKEIPNALDARSIEKPN